MPTNRAVGIWNASCFGVRSVREQVGEVPRSAVRKILVVDDDDELADLVRQVLRDAGYSVATVRHGAAALELLKHVAPDLILLDLTMPIMDGWSFVAQYRRVAKQGARLVLLTGNQHAPEIARNLVADGYITKPFDMEVLIATVGRELQVS